MHSLSWIPPPAKQSQILISKSLVLPHPGLCNNLSVAELPPPLSWGSFNCSKHAFDQNFGSATSWMHIPNSPALCFLAAQNDPTGKRRKQGCPSKSWPRVQQRECFLESHTGTLKDLPIGRYTYTIHTHTHTKSDLRLKVLKRIRNSKELF